MLTMLMTAFVIMLVILVSLAVLLAMLDTMVVTASDNTDTSFIRHLNDIVTFTV